MQTKTDARTLLFCSFAFGISFLNSLRLFMGHRGPEVDESNEIRIDFYGTGKKFNPTKHLHFLILLFIVSELKGQHNILTTFLIYFNWRSSLPEKRIVTALNVTS